MDTLGEGRERGMMRWSRKREGVERALVEVLGLKRQSRGPGGYLSLQGLHKHTVCMAAVV